MNTPTPEVKKRIETARENALLAFWAEVAKAFPESKSGDFPPDAHFQQDKEAEDAITLWLHYNTELLGIEVDSPKWFCMIADALKAKGYEASADQTGGGIVCVVVNVGRYTLHFGTANEVWGFDVYADDEFSDDLTNEYALNPATQMTLSSETPDPEKCAEQIAATIDIFEIDREGK